MKCYIWLKSVSAKVSQATPRPPCSHRSFMPDCWGTIFYSLLSFPLQGVRCIFKTSGLKCDVVHRHKTSKYDNANALHITAHPASEAERASSETEDEEVGRGWRRERDSRWGGGGEAVFLSVQCAWVCITLLWSVFLHGAASFSLSTASDRVTHDAQACKATFRWRCTDLTRKHRISAHSSHVVCRAHGADPCVSLLLHTCLNRIKSGSTCWPQTLTVICHMLGSGKKNMNYWVWKDSSFFSNSSSFNT